MSRRQRSRCHSRPTLMDPSDPTWFIALSDWSAFHCLVAEAEAYGLLSPPVPPGDDLPF